MHKSTPSQQFFFSSANCIRRAFSQNHFFGQLQSFSQYLDTTKFCPQTQEVNSTSYVRSNHVLFLRGCTGLTHNHYKRTYYKLVAPRNTKRLKIQDPGKLGHFRKNSELSEDIPSLLSRNKTLGITLKKCMKGDIKVYCPLQFCLISIFSLFYLF